MKIVEGYNNAVKNYGYQLPNLMYKSGIGKNYIDAACKFYTEGVPIEQLQDDFKKWNRYVLNNLSYSDSVNKNLYAFKSYEDFKRTIHAAMKPFICPNPIYNDGSLSIGELKTQKDARWFPIQNLAYPEDNNDFCVCKKAGGFLQFQKYKQLGYKMLIIYDKERSVNDEYKRLFVIARNGHLDFWNHFDNPCGTTKHNNDRIWNYISSLPHEAQIALSQFAENTLVNKQDTNMKTENRKRNVVRLAESKLTQIVAESVRKVLNEMQNDDFSMKCLNYLEQNEYSKESLSKVANLMFKNDRWTLYDGRHELLALATDQNGKLMYSFNQKAWQYVN